MEETAKHLFTECPAHVGTRIAYLGRPLLSIDMIREMPISKILRFAGHTGRWGQIHGEDA